MISAAHAHAQPTRETARGKVSAPAANPLRLLLVEDSDADAALFRSLIKATSFLANPQLVRARSIAEALQLIVAHSPDCVLLDLGLPDAIRLSGLDALRKLDPRAAILMLTGFDDDETALEALRNGAQDYVVKDQADDRTLGRAILRSIQRHQLMTELASEKQDAQFSARHDALTGLANRRQFEEILQQQCTRGADPRADWGVVMLDLDGFKAINDSQGHAAGDLVLKETARRLRLSIREGDLAARLGGDEFVLLVTAGLAPEAEEEFVQRLRRAIEEPILTGVHVHRVSSSIGIARHPADGAVPAQLLAAADQRMYADKQARRAR